MVALTLFSKDRRSSPKPSLKTTFTATAASSTSRKDGDEIEAKVQLYDRLSVRSPKPFSTCANDLFDLTPSSPSFSIRSLLKSSPQAGFIRTDEDFPLAISPDKEPSIPSPRVFAAPRHASSVVGPPNLPSVTQCAVHLEILEVFWHLKHRVTVEYAESFDVIFGHNGRGARLWREERGWGVDQLKKEVEWVEAERSRIWKAFVELAVQRFQRWWIRTDAYLTEQARRQSVNARKGVKFFDKKDVIMRWQQEVQEIASSSGAEAEHGGTELPGNLLPPVDVLMVWYCYILTPRVFYNNRDSPSRNTLWDVAFPWSSVYAAIDLSIWSYKADPDAVRHFERLMGTEFDLFDSLRKSLGGVTPYPHPQRLCRCPGCNETISVPVSNPTHAGAWSETNSLTCRSCQTRHTRSAVIKASPLKIDVAKIVLSNMNFWDEIHRHQWIRSPALSGKAYWGDVFIGKDARARPEFSQPAGTLERAIARLREFITSRGNATGTSLPLDVELVWRTLAVSPPALAACHPELSGKRLIQLASCCQTGVDRKKARMNAKRYGPSEWERCLCWSCEAARTEKDAVEKEHLSGGRPARKELEVWEKVAMRRKVKLVVDWFGENEIARREKRGMLDKELFAGELGFVDISRSY